MEKIWNTTFVILSPIIFSLIIIIYLKNSIFKKRRKFINESLKNQLSKNWKDEGGYVAGQGHYQNVWTRDSFFALMAPILGAISDETGQKKIWILSFSSIAILGTLSLWFVFPDKRSIPLALAAIAISLISFEFCSIFYNATLIKIANPGSIGKISGLGWATGYLGAILCLLFCLIGLVEGKLPFLRLDINQAEHIRATAVVVGLWWFIFGLPFFIFHKDEKPTAKFSGIHIVYNYDKWPINIDKSYTFPYLEKGSNYLIKEFPNEKTYQDSKEKIEEL